MNLKAIYPFLLSLVLLTTVILIDRGSFSSMREYTSQVDHTRQTINLLERLSNHFKSAQIYSTSFARIAPRNYYKLYYQEAENVHRELNQLKQLTAGDSLQTRRLATISGLIDQHWSIVVEYNIAEIVGSGQGWRLNDLFTIHRLINLAIEHEENLLQIRKLELTHSTRLTNNLTILFSILAIGILLAAFASNLALTHRRKWLEGFLESILNSSRNAIIHFQTVREKPDHTDFTVTYANTAVEELMRFKPTELVGKRLSQLPDFLHQTNLSNHLQEAMSTGPQRLEIQRREGPKTIWFDTVLAPLDDGLTATFHDITPIKQYQQELQENIRQLHRSNESLQQFAYVASHDLQEPLRKIQSFSRLLSEQYTAQLPEPAVDMLERMQMAAQRMTDLIQDLLTYSRLSTQPEFKPVSLQRIIDEVLTDLEVSIQEKKAHILVDSLPTLLEDALQLYQLFQNLLSNAVKFSHADGTAEIQVRCRQIKNSDLPAGALPRIQSIYFEIAVIDNGIGFDEQYRDRIFQLFQRLNSKSSYSGTGIGLAICKKVVENHQGYLTAHSQPNQGATFLVYLPVR